MKQTGMEDLVVQVPFNEKFKTISEEVRDILRKYEFRYATKQTKDEIKLDIETYFHKKFGYNETPNNFEIIFDENSCALSIVPSDKKTVRFWKEIGLL